MARTTKRNKQSKGNSRSLYIASGIGLVIIIAVAAALLLSQGAEQTAGTAATSQLISPTEYQSQFVASSSEHLLIDVRTPQEFASGHIAGAVNIPVESLAGRLSEVPQDQTVVLYCRSGNRSAQAAQILERAGYSGIYDLGGIIDWTAQGFPIE